MRTTPDDLQIAIERMAKRNQENGLRDYRASQRGNEMFRSGEGEVVLNNGAAHVRIIRKVD